jgi:DNA-binding transcriptional MerR regulator
LKEGLFISELSRHMNIPVPTIRYYEKLGLLNTPSRTESHYRVYSEESKERLGFIQQAKHFGLTLVEIKKLINIRTEGNPPCASLKVMVKQHLDELDQHIQEMIAFRKELASRYEKINTLLDSSAELAEAPDSSRICGLIEGSRFEQVVLAQQNISVKSKKATNQKGKKIKKCCG